jgi:NADPH:quinone reductase-like Zn-dependent oxidoreductase
VEASVEASAARGAVQTDAATTTMKAVVYDRYGSPEVLGLGSVEKPVPADDEVLVRVRAISVNPVDWHMMTGLPLIARLDAGVRKPKTGRLGGDFAGTVEAIGKNVTQFQPGDEVFGVRHGAIAEFVCVGEERAVVPKPANLTFEQAAAVPVAALTALQGLRDKGGLRPGHRVLVNGASGGVGTFGVQIAKALGAEVTGVCRTGNIDLVQSIGADHVVDYTTEDFTRGDRRYDVLLDIAGTRTWTEYRRVLTEHGTHVRVGGPKTNRVIGPLGLVLRNWLSAVGRTQSFAFFIAKPNKADLLVLSDLLESGKVTPVIDRRYELPQIADAFEYLGAGHARAKVIVNL